QARSRHVRARAGSPAHRAMDARVLRLPDARARAGPPASPACRASGPAARSPRAPTGAARTAADRQAVAPHAVGAPEHLARAPGPLGRAREERRVLAEAPPDRPGSVSAPRDRDRPAGGAAGAVARDVAPSPAAPAAAATPPAVARSARVRERRVARVRRRSVQTADEPALRSTLGPDEER